MRQRRSQQVTEPAVPASTHHVHGSLGGRAAAGALLRGVGVASSARASPTAAAPTPTPAAATAAARWHPTQHPAACARGGEGWQPGRHAGVLLRRGHRQAAGAQEADRVGWSFAGVGRGSQASAGSCAVAGEPHCLQARACSPQACGTGNRSWRLQGLAPAVST